MTFIKGLDVFTLIVLICTSKKKKKKKQLFDVVLQAFFRSFYFYNCNPVISIYSNKLFPFSFFFSLLKSLIKITHETLEYQSYISRLSFYFILFFLVLL
jgi:hypothetical protein